MHVMIDLETLSTRVDAAVVQIGAVAFEPLSGGKIRNGQGLNLYVRPHPDASVDPDTVAWWLTQSQGAREKLSAGLASAIPERDALERLADWPRTMDMTWENFSGVWSHGLTFDVPILESAFARHGMSPPWHYRSGRDTRTLFMLANGGRPPEIDWTGFVAHDALDDAVGQAMQVQKAMALLGR